MDDLIQVSWAVDKWLKDAWQLIKQEDKLNIKNRLNELFEDGLPFELKHEKIIYSHLFAMLCQLEILTVQIPLKFLKHIDDEKLSKLIKNQLANVIFHTAIISKVAYELSAPYTFPPEFNENTDQLCTLIKNENNNTKITIILLNLITKAWLTQIFEILSEHNISSNIFDTILIDKAHCEADAALYEILASYNVKLVTDKLAIVEEHLISNVFFQRKGVITLINLIGVKGYLSLINKIDNKYQAQLKIINLKPTKKWTSFVDVFPLIVDQVIHDNSNDKVVSLVTTREFLMGAWSTPKDPTMFSMFNLDVSKFGFFEKKYPEQTITGLILQTMSKLASEHPDLRNYICHNKMYNAKENFTYLVVNLPGETNHLAMIKFKDCHLISLRELSEHVKHDFEIMSYCRYKSNELSKKHPELLKSFNEFYLPDNNDLYQHIYAPDPVFSLSNVAPWGHEMALSPLLPFETIKLTIANIDKRQLWNNKTKVFDTKDVLPIGFSADHRIHDGNLGTKKMFQIAFNEVFDKFESEQSSSSTNNYSDIKKFVKFIDKALNNDLEFTFRFLMFSSQKWNNNIDLNVLYNKTNTLKVLMNKLKIKSTVSV